MELFNEKVDQAAATPVNVLELVILHVQLMTCRLDRAEDCIQGLSAAPKQGDSGTTQQRTVRGGAMGGGMTLQCLVLVQYLGRRVHRASPESEENAGGEMSFRTRGCVPGSRRGEAPDHRASSAPAR